MVVVLATAGSVPILFAHRVSADVEVSPWLSQTTPELENLGDLAQNQSPPYRIIGNRDCYERKVITRPKRPIPIWPYSQSELSYNSCVGDTAFGSIDTLGYLQRPGGTIAGPVKDINGRSTGFVPIPYSTTGMMLTGGTYLAFYDNMDSVLNSSAIYTGEVTHRITASPSAFLGDKSGKLLAVGIDSLSFSANGQWMVTDIPSVGVVARINTLNRQILPFGDSLNYNIGLYPGLQTAISADGRYAVMASRVFGIFKLYDLDTCGPVPNTISGKVKCAPPRDLQPYMSKAVPGFLGVSQLKFRGNYALDMYVDAKLGAIQQKSHQVLRAGGQTATPTFQYLALGDSFASGEGAYQYKASTDTNLNKCHLSVRSYPYLIGATLNFDKYESVACSGAVIDDFLRTDKLYEGQVKDNKTREDRNLDEILSAFSPGYLGQKEFIYKHKPNIITLSAGGNDIGFSDIINRCIDSNTCYKNYEDRLELVTEINGQFRRLVDLYSQVKNTSDPNARIYVLGYPELADPNGDCANNVHLNHDEIVFARELVNYLNAVTKAAANNAGVFYVDVENAFDGHKLCETVSPNTAVNGLTLGNDIPNISLVRGPIGNESFHPNDMGHRLFKTVILDKTTNLTAPMPAPDRTAGLPDISGSLPILNAPKSNRVMRITKNITGTSGGAIEFGKTWAFDYNPTVQILKAGSKIKAWLNSDPVFLGEFPVAADGGVSIATKVPDNVSPGFHTLHLYGLNTSGEDVDLYQTVYVAGDSLQGECVIVPDSGEDVDQDGVDDACDGFIDEPPLAVEPVADLPPEELVVIPPGPEQPLETSDEPTPNQTTDNPQTLAMVDTNIKPLVNNPETVAGDEELVDTLADNEHMPQSLAQNTPITPPNNIQPASTQIAPDTLVEQTNPQVAAASTNTSSQPKSTIPSTAPPLQEVQDFQTTPLFKALMLLLAVSAITVVIKLFHSKI